MAKGKYHEWLTEEGLVLLKAWARDGYTDEMLAQKMGISTSTLYDWKGKYPEISEALKKGKEFVDVQVENALLKRALGFEYDEVMEEAKTDEYGNITEKHKKITKKMIPPDTGAAMAWLKNRCPKKWRNDQEHKVEHGFSENVGGTSIQFYIPDNGRDKGGDDG